MIEAKDTATLGSLLRRGMAPLAANHINPHMITEHGQRSKCLKFPEGGKLEGLEKKNLVAKKRTNANSNDIH